MQGYDAIVVGLGGMGSALAHQLAARGQRVLGIERFYAGHDRGSSHGGSRVTRQAYAEHPAYVPLMARAYELWRQAERDSGRGLLTMTGGIIVGPAGSGLVTGARASAREWDLPHELLDAGEVRRRYPTLRPGTDDVGVYEPSAGFVRPEESVLAHCELAARAGADLRFGERVESWSTTGEGVTVRTSAGAWTADRLVLCAGAWAPGLLAESAVSSDVSSDMALTVERQVMHWFAPADLEPFRADRHPVFLWGDQSDILLYGVPVHDDQTSVKVAFFRRPGRTDPDEVDRHVHPAEIEEMAAALRERIPALPARHVASQTCLYTLTPDRHFVLGRHPNDPRVLLAAGFSGHGFKFVPVVAEVLADLATTGTTRHDIGLFDPSRAGLYAG